MPTDGWKLTDGKSNRVLGKMKGKKNNFSGKF